MGRPFIEFIQSQALPWQEDVPGGFLSGVRSKTLSQDASNGAVSLIISYPAGWSRDRSPHGEYLSADEEIFVLSGELIINGINYSSRHYAHLPGGFPRTSASSPGGAIVLTFYSGNADFRPGVADDGAFDERRLVLHIDALEGNWGGNFHPDFPPGAGRKFLRRDPVDGEETWILGTMPLRSGLRAEQHPVVEEMFLLSGELVGPLGVMQPGSYFWRPPRELHGPFGSLTGNLMLFRTKGGPLSTFYADETEFTWNPGHQPILPASMRQFDSDSTHYCRCY